jgi:Tol biopolymer transport system component
MIGTRLGPYEITAKLGEGGMGQVFQAKDFHLGRNVALKVLPEGFTQDPERLQRFEREAKLLAQLNHPNVAQIYGFEASGEIRALVMELVEGPTLAERLEQGPLPFDESLSVSLQIAHALEEAHEKGIVHRDLKPQNIKASLEGKVKVLDFGLAKAMDPAAGSAASAVDMARSPTLMQSPTLTAVHGTQLGVILGTAAYMAPEQARGFPIDKRADIWAFGVVLYEMLVGASLFAGDTVTDTLAGVLKTEVDFAKLPASTPAAVRQLLRRCLERNPKNRLHDIADARLVLEEVASGRSDESAALSSVAEATRSRSPASRWLPWAAALAGVAIGIAGWLRPAPPGVTGAHGGTTARATHFVVPPPGPGEVIGYPAPSPDGRAMAFCFAAERSVPRLWLHSFETGSSRELPGTDLAEQPFWSPDGRHVGFVARGQLRTLELATGQLEALATASDPRGASWGETGEIFFSPTCCSGLSAVAATGGSARVLTQVDSTANETSHRFPWALPGGGALLYTIPNGRRAGIYRQELTSTTAQRILPQTARGVFDARGFLLWAREGALVARRFDPSSGALAGDTFLVTQAVGSDPDKTSQDLFGAAGGVVAVRPPRTSRRELRWLDRKGVPAEIVASDGYYYDPSYSPRHRRIAVAKSPTPNYFDSDIWIVDGEGPERATRLTFTGDAATPIWSPDGESVYFMSDEGGRFRILGKRVDGSGGDEVLHESATGVWIDDVSRGEPLLAVEGTASDGNYKLWLLRLGGDRAAMPFQHGSAGSQTHSTFSPDGRLLAYTSDESGVPQIYVQPVDGSSGRWQVSRDGGDLATWRADGGEIYFVGLDRLLRAVSVRSLAPFAVGDEVALFPLRIPPLAITSQHAYYTASADGRRFLVNQAAGAPNEPGIQVTLGWTPPVAAGARP